MDGYYVYDELVNPYQQWLDQGWELQFIPTLTEAEQPHYNWGEEEFLWEHYIPMWYGPDGTIYDPYGEKIAVLDDPSFRFDNSFQYGFWMQDHVFTSSFTIERLISVSIADDEKLGEGISVVAEWDTPISSIHMGTGFSAG